MSDEMITKVQENSDRIFFPNLGNDNIFTNGIKIDKVLFNIPVINQAIYVYGFLIAIGILLALVYAFSKTKKHGIDPDRLTDTIIGGIIGAIIGARLYFVIFSWSDYLTAESKIDWKAIISIRDGGLAIYGGLIGALIIGGIIAKLRKISIPSLFDLAGMGFLIGQALGRWGNFFNQEAYGKLTKLPWGMTSAKIMTELTEYISNDLSYTTINQADMVAHPCFLYESIWCIIGFILINSYSKHRKFDGELFLMYIGWYGCGRMFIEGLRTDSLYIGNNLRVSQLLAGICVAVAVLLIVIIRGKVKRSGDYKFFYETEISKAQIAGYDMEMEKQKLKSKNKNKENAYVKPIIDVSDDENNEADLIENNDEIDIPNDDNVDENDESTSDGDDGDDDNG